ncbi:hypothetical protein SynBIOSE41_01498 [Synechococcus sp. BIOS-E4-1]|nr:hypothetical protein SynBIOSE41_01498 [Synechococcus sp. BIOS-E4-1]
MINADVARVPFRFYFECSIIVKCLPPAFALSWSLCHTLP